MTEEKHIFNDGDAYERLMGHWSREAGSIFIDWLSPSNGLKWLDVGCGTGAFTDLVCERCTPSRICAIDPSKEQIDYAQARPSTGDVDFRTGDAQRLPFGRGEFDMAAMALAINFVPDPALAVAEMRRVVAPKGTVASYIWDFAGERATQGPLIKAIKDMGFDVPPVPRVEFSTGDKLREMFVAADLQEITQRTIDIQIEFANFDDYWSSQTGLVTPAVEPIMAMSSAEVDSLKSLLNKKLSANGDGRIGYSASVNAIKGKVAA